MEYTHTTMQNASNEQPSEQTGMMPNIHGIRNKDGYALPTYFGSRQQAFTSLKEGELIINNGMQFHIGKKIYSVTAGEDITIKRENGPTSRWGAFKEGITHRVCTGKMQSTAQQLEALMRKSTDIVSDKAPLVTADATSQPPTLTSQHYSDKINTTNHVVRLSLAKLDEVEAQLAALSSPTKLTQNIARNAGSEVLDTGIRGIICSVMGLVGSLLGPAGTVAGVVAGFSLGRVATGLLHDTIGFKHQPLCPTTVKAAFTDLLSNATSITASDKKPAICQLKNKISNMVMPESTKTDYAIACAATAALKAGAIKIGEATISATSVVTTGMSGLSLIPIIKNKMPDAIKAVRNTRSTDTPGGKLKKENIEALLKVYGEYYQSLEQKISNAQQMEANLLNSLETNPKSELAYCLYRGELPTLNVAIYTQALAKAEKVRMMLEQILEARKVEEDTSVQATAA